VGRQKPSNICLRGDTFRQRLHAPSLRVFRPDRVNVNRRERNSAIGIKRNRYHIIAVSLGEHPRFLDRRASRFFNRCDHRIIRTLRQRNSQRNIAPMAESFRPRTAGGCVGHTGATSSCIPLTGAGVMIRTSCSTAAYRIWQVYPTCPVIRIKYRAAGHSGVEPNRLPHCRTRRRSSSGSSPRQGFLRVCTRLYWIHPQIIPTNGHFSWESGLPARCLWMSVSTTDNDAARAVVFLGQKVQPYRLNNP
jgi:hypothetical protein